VASEAVGEVGGAVLESIGERPDLAVVTVTRAHAGALEDIVATIGSVLHPLAMVGGAAESVLGTGREVEETAAISLWAGWIGPLAPVRLTATRLADGGWHFDGWPVHLPFDPTLLLLVADPFTFPTAEFLPWLAERRPGLPVVGGNASGGHGPGGSRLVHGRGMVSNGATGVLLGSGIDAEVLVSQGCRPYGDTLTVTRSDRNIVYEVAGLPAMECLVGQITRHLDPADVAGIESNGLLLGRVVDQRIGDPRASDYLVRSVVGVDRDSGALAVEDRVPLGSTVRFHHRDAGTADRELTQMLEGRRADAGLVFTCHGRGTRLFDAPHHDATALAHSVGPVPIGGLFAGGEFGPVGGHNFVHQFSASVVLLRSR
jgi:small ligand-binding sensory domain FIST